jgi:large subunit ribosomal protein L23
MYTLSKIIENPVITEKSQLVADLVNKQIVFKVRKQSTKIQVKKAVELMFNVKVKSVNLLNVKGKEKKFGRSIGHRSDWKKAYVTLTSGQDIEFSVA